MKMRMPIKCFGILVLANWTNGKVEMRMTEN